MVDLCPPMVMVARGRPGGAGRERGPGAWPMDSVRMAIGFGFSGAAHQSSSGARGRARAWSTYLH